MRAFSLLKNCEFVCPEPLQIPFSVFLKGNKYDIIIKELVLMKMETEITVLVKSTYNDLKEELEKNGFQIKEEYVY